MHNPFPGMNPYLEQPGLWPQVHNRLIVAIADDITPQVAPRYRVSIEERVYASTEAMPLIGIADVAVTRRPAAALPTTTAAQLVAPRWVQVPVPVEVTERFLEVRLVQTNEVVCVIEILSPANKRSGDGRRAYETKRQKILGSATNLVEIDLLRGGSGMAVAEPPQKTYSILVSASVNRPNAELYEFDLADLIPSFPVPLQPNEDLPVVNLQRVLNDVYNRARFDLAIDYCQPLQPALSSDEAAWVESLVNS
ncbi:DUF4058 family protein [Nodosilinea sp. LEGE 07088]|uniref:DUF4058 family protein n=1 Tax=Nodosilinea sp. LEGE 07088 TaxID=2777968 RepID=UPI00187E73F7|nr:DUF4058 family protein [Nodosilinea sp. LEGE 07088]MBE9138017.1 DUF4058 family protein [Nodosilinea sp. LEGE 07088]